MGAGSATLAVLVGFLALYVAFGTSAVYCAGWEETFLIAGGLTIFSGVLEFGEETTAAEIVVGIDAVLFVAYAGGYLLGSFTCSTHLF